MISRILSVLAALGLVASSTAKVKPVGPVNGNQPTRMDTVPLPTPLPMPPCSEGQPWPPTCP
jgi:hypothetical protein